MFEIINTQILTRTHNDNSTLCCFVDLLPACCHCEPCALCSRHQFTAGLWTLFVAMMIPDGRCHDASNPVTTWHLLHPALYNYITLCIKHKCDYVADKCFRISSLGSRCIPWLGEGLSMPSPNYPVLCCPLP